VQMLPPSRISGGSKIEINGYAQVVLVLSSVRYVMVHGKLEQLDFYKSYRLLEIYEICPNCRRVLRAGVCLCGYSAQEDT
jgi:hypothetical protein